MNVQQVQMKEYSSVLAVFGEVKAELSKVKNDQWKWIYRTTLFINPTSKAVPCTE
jgi:hypothetical protein